MCIFVSIVVISKDRRDDLEKAVDSLVRLDYPREYFEIVVWKREIAHNHWKE